MCFKSYVLVNCGDKVVYLRIASVTYLERVHSDSSEVTSEDEGVPADVSDEEFIDDNNQWLTPKSGPRVVLGKRSNGGH